MDRFVRRVAPKLAADGAPQPVEVAAAAAPQRGARLEAVANPDADATDEAESNGEASSVEGEYSHITGLLDELAKEQPAAGQWTAQLPSDAEVTSSFTIPRAERIVQEMYDWYEARVDDEEVHAVFRHLQNTLFKNVTVQLPEDDWKHPDVGGASQPAAQGEAHLVVSREHVARQVQTVIAWRETWLQDRGLPLDTVIRGDLADFFLDAAKSEFHASAVQQELQERDADRGKIIQDGKHSRWSRRVQKLGGTPQMWTLLSFTGRFDVAFLENAIARGAKVPPRMPGEKTQQQKQQVRDAQMGRARLRRGAMLERLQERLSQGNKAKGKGKRKARPLNPKQLRVLQEYQSGDLRRQANNLTMISGHGRLKKEDHSFVDIGGCTGGFTRTVLDDWEPPDLADFEGDASLVW